MFTGWLGKIVQTGLTHVPAFLLGGVPISAGRIVEAFIRDRQQMDQRNKDMMIATALAAQERRKGGRRRTTATNHPETPPDIDKFESLYPQIFQSAQAAKEKRAPHIGIERKPARPRKTTPPETSKRSSTGSLISQKRSSSSSTEGLRLAADSETQAQLLGSVTGRRGRVVRRKQSKRSAEETSTDVVEVSGFRGAQAQIQQSNEEMLEQLRRSLLHKK